MAAISILRQHPDSRQQSKKQFHRGAFRFDVRQSAMKLNPLRFLAGPLSNHRNTRVFFEVFVLSCLAVLAVKPSFAGEETNSIEAGAFRVDSLPFLRTGVQTHQFCSYDRAGDNFDWEYFPLYTDTNGECVIFDATGPGCLYRQQMNIWAGPPTKD